MVILFSAVVLLVYGPTFWTAGFRWALSFFGGFLVLLFSSSVLFLSGSIDVEVDASGLEIFSTHYDWEDIQKIQKGWMPFAIPVSLIWVKRKERRSWFWNLFSHQKGFQIPAVPDVYSKLLPAIRSFRPELPIDDSISAEAGREPALVFFRVVVFLIILFSSLIFLGLYFDSTRGTGIYLKYGSYFFFVGFPTCIIITLLAGLSRGWSNFCFHLIIVHILFFFQTFIHPMPLPWTTVFVFLLGVSGLGLVVVLFNPDLSVEHELILLAGLTILPLVSWPVFDHLHQPLAYRTIRMDGGGMGPPIWSVDGKYFTFPISGRRQKMPVVHTKDQNVVYRVPRNSYIRWMDDSFLIRQIRENKQESEHTLEAIKLRTGTSLGLTTAEEIRVSGSRPVNNRKWIIWLEKSNEVSRWGPRIYDLRKNREVNHSLSWNRFPDRWQESPGRVSWSGKASFVWQRRIIRESKKNGAKRLKKLGLCFYDLNTGEQRIWQSSYMYQRWSISSGYQYVLGMSEDESGRLIADLWKTGSGQITSLSYLKAPVWLAGRPYAVGIQSVGGRPVLTRLHAETGASRVVADVPRGMNWIGLSGSGRFALFHNGGQMFNRYVVIDLKRDRQRSVYLPGIQGIMGLFVSKNVFLEKSYFGTNYFSPDDRGLLLSSSDPLTEGSMTHFFVPLADDRFSSSK